MSLNPQSWSPYGKGARSSGGSYTLTSHKKAKSLGATISEQHKDNSECPGSSLEPTWDRSAVTGAGGRS